MVPKCHCCVQKSPPFFPFLTEISAVQVLALNVHNTYFNIILRLTPISRLANPAVRFPWHVAFSTVALFRPVCEIRKATVNFVMSVCPSAWNNFFLLDGFSWNMIFQFFSKLYATVYIEYAPTFGETSYFHLHGNGIWSRHFLKWLNRQAITLWQTVRYVKALRTAWSVS